MGPSNGGVRAPVVLLIALVLVVAGSIAFVVSRPPGAPPPERGDAISALPGSGENAAEDGGNGPTSRRERNRVAPPPKSTPALNDRRALLDRALAAFDSGRVLEALLIVLPPRSEPAEWVPSYAEVFAVWEDTLLDDLEGDAEAGRKIPDDVLAGAKRALLLADSQRRLQVLLDRLGKAARATELAILDGTEQAEERDAIARHLARFGRSGTEIDAADRTWVDPAIDRVRAREWSRRVTKLDVTDPAAVERRRVEQLERLRARGVTSLLERIHAGLAWLALHQSDAGALERTRTRCLALHGDKKSVCSQGEKESGRTLAATSLAVLAFLDFRDQDARGVFEESLARGVDWIVRQQRKDGSFGRRGYDSALALMALGQAAGASGDARVVQAVEKGWQYQATLAGPRGGYRYGSGGAGDLSVTAWVVQAYEAAREAGIDAPGADVVEAMLYFVKSTRVDETHFSYMVGQSAHASLQSAGMLALQVLGEVREDATRERFAKALAATAKVGARPARQVNLYGLYYDVRMELLLSEDLSPARRQVVLEYAEDFQIVDGFRAGMFDPSPDATVTTKGKTQKRNERWLSRSGIEPFTAFSVLTLEHTLFKR